MIKRSPERVKFLSDLMLTGMQGAHYWGTAFTLDDAANSWTVEDGEDDKEYVVTIDTIARGIRILTTGDNKGKAFTMSGMDYWKQFLLANRTNGEDGDYDSDIADNVLQAGIFGEVIYG